jgi:hypothetical protein
MAEIVPIPTVDDRVWRWIDRLLGQTLARGGLGTEAHRLISADLHRRLADVRWQQRIEWPAEMDRATVQLMVNRTAVAWWGHFEPLFGAMVTMAVDMYVAGSLPLPSAGDHASGDIA